MKKKSIIFAASLKGTILKVFVCVVYFIATHAASYADEYRLSNSNGCCASKPVIVPFKTEKDSLSSFSKYFNFSFMKGTMKNQSGVKYSSAAMTSAYESGSDATHKLQVSPDTVCFTDLVAEMQKHFDIEKNAKNKAYAFILACGLYSQFAKFCQHCHSDDWHDTCLKQLVINES